MQTGIWFRLYDIDIVISKAVLYCSLAAFITAVYVGLVVGVGTLAGGRGRPLRPAEHGRPARRPGRQARDPVRPRAGHHHRRASAHPPPRELRIRGPGMRRRPGPGAGRAGLS